MSMSKKDFIALADALKYYRKYSTWNDSDTRAMRTGNADVEWDIAATARRHEFHLILQVLASFCKQQNSNFMRERWLDYIAGKCGKNGGKVAA